jgi:pyruvate/2-oxoglutarate dehydrogenase complex dihydrolipoamide dehydrogenase (E3) component
LTAEQFIIATGSKVAEPPLDALREINYLTSDSALELTRLPKSLIVLGGGPVAVEFSQFFARFGVRVTLIQRGEHILNGLDTDASTVIEQVFRREGIEMITGTEITGAHSNPPGKTISFRHHGHPASVTAEEVLFALGRSPNTAALQLENAGVETKDARIIANEFMQTSAPHIYAAGDCIGPYEIVHIGIRQGKTAATHIIRPDLAQPIDDRLLLQVIFTDPQAAIAGLTETSAKARNLPCITARHSFADHGKSLIMDAKDGFVKLLADPQSGEIIGGACVGPHGGELIHEIITAMAKHMTVTEFTQLPHYHPTLAEIWEYPAEELAEQFDRCQTQLNDPS